MAGLNQLMVEGARNLPSWTQGVREGREARRKLDLQNLQIKQAEMQLSSMQNDLEKEREIKKIMQRVADKNIFNATGITGEGFRQVIEEIAAVDPAVAQQFSTLRNSLVSGDITKAKEQVALMEARAKAGNRIWREVAESDNAMQRYTDLYNQAAYNDPKMPEKLGLPNPQEISETDVRRLADTKRNAYLRAGGWLSLDQEDKIKFTNLPKSEKLDFLADKAEQEGDMERAEELRHRAKIAGGTAPKVKASDDDPLKPADNKMLAHTRGILTRVGLDELLGEFSQDEDDPQSQSILVNIASEAKRNAGGNLPTELDVAMAVRDLLDEPSIQEKLGPKWYSAQGAKGPIATYKAKVDKVIGNLSSRTNRRAGNAGTRRASPTRGTGNKWEGWSIERVD